MESPPRETATDHLARARASVAVAVACEHCPDVTAQLGVEVLTEMRRQRPANITQTVKAKAKVLVKDAAWRRAVLAWISDYRSVHQHGPTWREVRQAPGLWPEDTSTNVRRTAMHRLAAAQHLEGTDIPFGLAVRAGDA